MLRSHTCGELRAGDEGKNVSLCGWVHSRRDHGGVAFVDLRDTTGLTQVVFGPGAAGVHPDDVQSLRNEYCIRVAGTVARRKEGTVNPKLATGEIEVMADDVEVLSTADTPPFQVDDHQEVDETLRLKYRFLDLRRERMQQNLKLRHAIVSAIRRFYDAEGFLEIETPMLTRATPEGARDYLVPSRVHPGKFYALPQSPQLFKQLFMVSGLDRYYQIVRCFRDEDLRADRQPDFTQLDVEMSFVDVEDVLDSTERMFRFVWREALGVDLPPFARLTYRESMDRFGVDKPDLRFGMELADLADVFAGTEVKVFQSVLGAGGAVKAIAVGGKGDLARKELDGIVEEAKALGAGGLVWIAVTGAGGEKAAFKSPIDKFFTDDERQGLLKATGAGEGDLILIVADKRISIVYKVLGALRNRLAARFGFVPERARTDPGAWRFAWITDFPWFERNEEEDRWEPIHHPFTGVVEDTLQYLDTDPGRVISKSYDITLNGWELASGSIRIHDAELQQRMFGALGISKEVAEEKFGFLLRAFRYGPPPHGGIAPGIDRIVALAAGETNIREVIAFPKTQTAYDPLTDAPSEVDEAQLKVLHLKSTPPVGAPAASAGGPREMASGPGQTAPVAPT
ncbi:MAG: aspartate--tRNA ligase [Actinomycetota bacterium]|nr:aspartate--tRNA ligase [Actinomycetota bacterium]